MQKASPFSSFFEGLPPAYWLLWTGTLINRLGGFVVPFLTLYLTRQRSIPVSQAALMVSLLGAGSFLSQLVGGELTDRLGRRPMMVISFLVTPVFMLALGFARSVPVIAVCLFLLGFFTDLYRPAVSAAVVDLVQPEYRTRGFGYIYWAINLGAAVAPVLAGWMANYSYLTLFVGDAITTLAFGLIVLFGFRETRPVEAAQHAAHTSPRRRIDQIKRAPVLMLFSLLALFIGIVYSQGTVTLPLDMASHGLEPGMYGLAIAVNGLLIILITIPLSNLAARWPRFPAMALAAVFLGFGFGLTGLASDLPLFMLSVAIWTLGEIVASTVAPVIIADLSPIELRGLFQGIFGSSWGMAFFLGPIIGGWIFESWGASVLWGTALVIGLVLGAAYLAMGNFISSHRVLQEKSP